MRTLHDSSLHDPLFYKEKTMKRSLCFVITLAVLFGTLSTSFAQTDAPRLYWVQHFMKVNPENRSDYEQLESNVWKPVHVERKKNGKLVDWFFFKVISPFGTDSEYDYVTGQIYSDFGSINSSPGAQEWQAAHPEGHPLAKRTGELRQIVNSAILVDSGSIPSNFHRNNVNNVFFWKVPNGLGGEFLSLRKNYFRPAAQNSIDQGRIESWYIGRKMFPANAANDYHFQTHDVFHTLSDVAAGHGSNLKSIPELTDDQRQHIISRMGATKQLHKRELWQLLDTTQDRGDEIDGVYAKNFEPTDEFTMPKDFSNGVFKIICDGVRRVIRVEDGEIKSIHGGPARFDGSTIREQAAYASNEEWLPNLPSSTTYNIESNDGSFHQLGIKGSGKNEDLNETWVRMQPNDSAFEAIEGVWQIEFPNGNISTKIKIDNFWNWVVVNPKTNQVMESLGGSYTFDGDNYIEHIDFQLNNADKLNGNWKVSTELSGNQLIHSGKHDELPEGMKEFYDGDFQEIWTRAK